MPAGRENVAATRPASVRRAGAGRRDGQRSPSSAGKAGGRRSDSAHIAPVRAGLFQAAGRLQHGASASSHERHASRSPQSTSAVHGSGRRHLRPPPNDLSRRTEQQAASLEETAAALDQITATVASSRRGRQRGPRGGRRGQRQTPSSPARSSRKAVAAMSAIEQLVAARSARSSASSTRSPSRPTCWR